jgi:hypothetical protein
MAVWQQGERVRTDDKRENHECGRDPRAGPKITDIIIFGVIASSSVLNRIELTRRLLNTAPFADHRVVCVYHFRPSG